VVSLDIFDDSGIVACIGPNGAGKTTLLKLVAGILFPEKGTITNSAADGTGYPRWAKRNVAYIPAGERGLVNKLTGRENILYFGCLKGVSPKDVTEKLDELKAYFAVDDILDVPVEKLSNGQNKKIQVLCGLCSNMRLLLLDEPTLGLDIDAITSLVSLIRIVRDSYGMKIFLSSHDIDFVSESTDQFVFLIKGEIRDTVAGKCSAQEIRDAYHQLKDAP